MASKSQQEKRAAKLKSALRENLKKRKVQTRKLATEPSEDAVKLRERELLAKTKTKP